MQFDLKIDWILLRQQKEWLLSQPDCSEVEGLLSLIDFLQDDAERQGVAADEIWGEKVVSE